MTWPELVAVRLAERDGTTVMLPKAWPRTLCLMCGDLWACVQQGRGAPRLCLRCWYGIRRQPVEE